MEGVKVPIEVQIKTEAMSIAQDTIHDSLYKKKEMPKEIRSRLSRVIFPIIENMAQIDGFIDKSNPKTKEQLIQDVKQIKLNNIEILKQYSDILKIVNQQYKDIILIKKKEKTIELQDFFTQDVKSELEEKTAEMHDQKSEQHFKDIESGKYSVPPPYVENIHDSATNLTETGIDTKNIEQKGLIIRPRGLRISISNFFNKVKDFNLFEKLKESNFLKKIMNKNENTETDTKSVDIATEKMEAMKKNFDSRIIVSKEEQEKNRIEYEQQKQKTASITVVREEQEGQEH